MNVFTAGLAQMYPKIGDVKANLQTHLDLISQAATEGVQLLVFPELSLTGYYLRDLVHEVALTMDSPIFVALRNASRQYDVDLVVGFVDTSPRNTHHIAAAYIGQGEVLHIHQKVYLPTYTLFDDKRYFDEGEHLRTFDTQFGRMGMLVCEDFWHFSTPYTLWLGGADIMLFQSASPGRGLNAGNRLGTSRWVEQLLHTYSSSFATFIVHCNRVGFEDGEIFWGGSSIVDPTGAVLVEAPQFDPALVHAPIDLNQLRRSRSHNTTLRDERLALTIRELTRILNQPYDQK